MATTEQVKENLIRYFYLKRVIGLLKNNLFSNCNLFI
jgi:hypothetical protein